MELLAVVTTVSDERQAEVLATAAVEQRLAACVHAEAIRSTYRWKQSVEKDSEVRLLFKTTKATYERLEQLLLQLHPYELPAIFALPVTEATSAYTNWVHESISPSQA